MCLLMILKFYIALQEKGKTPNDSFLNALDVLQR